MNVFDDMAALLDAAREDNECPYPTYSRMIDLYYKAKDENEALWRVIGNCDDDEIERLIDVIDNLRQEREADQVRMDNLKHLLKTEEGVSERLRELVRRMYPRAKAFLQMGVRLGCTDTLSYDWELQMRELGIEVDDV